MPYYGYICKKCHVQITKHKGMTECGLTEECPICKDNMDRVFYPAMSPGVENVPQTPVKEEKDEEIS